MEKIQRLKAENEILCLIIDNLRKSSQYKLRTITRGSKMDLIPDTPFIAEPGSKNAEATKIS